MSKLYNFFKQISTDKKKMTKSSTGKDFEEQIKQKMSSSGFIYYTQGNDKTLDKYIQEIKPSIQAKLNHSIIPNKLAIKDPVKYSNIIYPQPYGKQDFPDFLVFTEYQIYSLEIKYSTSDSKKPMWNSNLPKKDGLYIFGCYGCKDITFFKGEDVLPEKEREIITSLWDKTDKIFEKWEKEFKMKIEDNSIGNNYGFEPYIRKAYSQSKNNNKNAIIDFFENKNRSTLEENVFKFIEDTDKPETSETNKENNQEENDLKE